MQCLIFVFVQAYLYSLKQFYIAHIQMHIALGFGQFFKGLVTPKMKIL